MCFYPGKSAKVKVAEKDIVCYKILLGDDLGAVYAYPYLKNKRTPVIELKIRQNSLEKSYITRGYHSFKQLKSAIVSGFAWEHIGKFVIPKGALYYSNKSEYVSETIIFVKRLEKYSKCF
jgi:hypothetical protein